MAKKFINLVTYLLITLFIYAGIAKVHDLATFQGQMMQSPIIPMGWIEWISLALPIGEIVIVVLLIIPKTKIIGFGVSYSIMLFFTLYLITLIIFYGDNVPCACGGILGQMGYPIHIIFNIFFTLISLIAFIFSFKDKINESKNAISL